MQTKILGVVISVLALVGCQQNSDERALAFAESDLEELALFLLDQELIDEDLMAEMSEEDVEEAVKSKIAELKKADKAIRADAEKVSKAIKAEFDINGDGKLDEAERAALKEAIKAKITEAKAKKGEDEKGWQGRKDEICAKIEGQLSAANESASANPMFQRVMARCENVEMPEQGSLHSNAGKICDKISAMIAAKGETVPEGLSKLSEKCTNGTFGGKLEGKEAKGPQAAEDNKG